MGRANQKIREEARRLFLSREFNTNAEIAVRLVVKPHKDGTSIHQTFYVPLVAKTHEREILVALPMGGVWREKRPNYAALALANIICSPDLASAAGTYTRNLGLASFNDLKDERSQTTVANAHPYVIRF